MKVQHPAVQFVLDGSESGLPATGVDGTLEESQTTSLSLARALTVGCLSGLDPSLASVSIWDPAAGSGLTGFTLANALESAGVRVCYRGQDISNAAVEVCRSRFEAIANAEIANANTLEHDEFDELKADLVIVDAPWGMTWTSSAPAVEARRASGSFGFGVPQRSDSTWLFISLALEKLRPAAEGGGRVAALVS